MSHRCCCLVLQKHEPYIPLVQSLTKNYQVGNLFFSQRLLLTFSKSVSFLRLQFRHIILLISRTWVANGPQIPVTGSFIFNQCLPASRTRLQKKLRKSITAFVRSADISWRTEAGDSQMAVLSTQTSVRSFTALSI